jgi:hypothetical protein
MLSSGRAKEIDPVLQHLGDDQLNQLIDLVGRNVGSPDLALRFGADMPALPARTVRLHRRQHLLSGCRHPLRIHMRARRRGRVESFGDHGSDRLRSAEGLDGLGMPGGAPLGQGAGFVLGLPGLQGGLLRQLQGFHRGRRPTMITLKLGRQLTLPVLDQRPPRRPTLVQRRVHADDLRHRPLTRILVVPISEPHPQSVPEMMFQGGVVGLRGSNRGFEQHPAVDRQPPPAKRLNLVRHRHMSVQIRITSAAVAMRKRRCYQPADIHLPDPLRALPGKQRLLLQKPKRVVYGRVVGQFDLCRDVGVGDRPQC